MSIKFRNILDAKAEVSSKLVIIKKLKRLWIICKLRTGDHLFYTSKYFWNKIRMNHISKSQIKLFPNPEDKLVPTINWKEAVDR